MHFYSKNYFQCIFIIKIISNAFVCNQCNVIPTDGSHFLEKIKILEFYTIPSVSNQCIVIPTNSGRFLRGYEF